MIKLLAIAVGAVTLVRVLSGGVFGLPSGVRLAQWAILVLLSLGLLVAITDRYRGREIVAMIFILLNNLGHWGMVVALASEPGPGVLLPLFAGLMLAGDLVKLIFLKVHDYTVRDYSRVVLYGLTLVYVVGYSLILLLERLG